MTISGPPPSVGGIREPEPTRAVGSEVKTESLKSQVAEGFIKALATTTFEILAAFISRPMAAQLSRTAMLAPFMGQRIKPSAVLDHIVQERQVRKVQERVATRGKGSVDTAKQLTEVKDVLAECAQGTHKPHLGRDGTLRAVGRSAIALPDSEVGSSTGTESALRSMLLTLETSMRVGVDPPKLKSGKPGTYSELISQFSELPQAVGLASRDRKFAELLNRVTTVGAAIDKHTIEGTIKPKDEILREILSDGNSELSSLMIQTHRNNGQTANLFDDLITQLDKTKHEDGHSDRLKNLVVFAQNYLREGDSVPLGGPTRAALMTSLTRLADLGEDYTQSDDVVDAAKQLRSMIPTLTEKPAASPGIDESVRLDRPAVSPGRAIVEPLQLEGLSSDVFSTQACALLEQRFLAIRPSELDGVTATKAEVKQALAPNVLNFVKVFNKITSFAEHQIVFSESPKEAAAKVLAAAVQAKEQGNYPAALALYAALEKTSVARMKVTIFDQFSPDQKKQLADLKEFLTSSNYAKIGEAVESSVSSGRACVPHIGLYMRQITNLAEGMDDVTSTEIQNEGRVTTRKGVNLRKNRAFADVKATVKTLQNTLKTSGDRLAVDSAFAEGLAEFSTTENEVYQQSLIVEPRQA